jgi:hypothetical protein
MREILRDISFSQFAKGVEPNYISFSQVIFPKFQVAMIIATQTIDHIKLS